MKNLVNFLIHYSVVILFLILEVTAFTIIVREHKYQSSVFFSSSNSLVATMYEWNNSFVEFFTLKAANENLSEENTALKNELVKLRAELSVLQPQGNDSVHFRIPPEMEYRFIRAKVINSSTNKLQNYITLNKGSRDGIRPDMGVVAEDGVVGIVKTVNEKFSVVIPVLNPKIEINCKFKRTNYSGPLEWDGTDYRYANLKDIARHVKLSLGDTLVTSGFTSTFPEGIPVGFVEDFKIRQIDPYFNIKVKLAVNFRTLSHVKVIEYMNYKEQHDLEKAAEDSAN